MKKIKLWNYLQFLFKHSINKLNFRINYMQLNFNKLLPVICYSRNINIINIVKFTCFNFLTLIFNLFYTKQKLMASHNLLRISKKRSSNWNSQPIWRNYPIRKLKFLSLTYMLICLLNLAPVIFFFSEPWILI